eukprot:912772_1
MSMDECIQFQMNVDYTDSQLSIVKDFLDLKTSKDGRMHQIRDGRKSFPSGHSATSAWFATYTFLFTIWVILKKRSYVSGMLLAITMPFMGYCGWVMYTRIVDHKHHLWDVLAGCGLGVVFASVFFSLWAIFLTLPSPSPAKKGQNPEVEAAGEESAV